MDRRQQIVRFGGSLLTSQELGETRRRTQLERLRLLAACDLDGSAKAPFRKGDGTPTIDARWLTIDKQRLALEPMQLRVVPALGVLFPECQGAGEQREDLRCVSGSGVDLRRPRQ